MKHIIWLVEKIDLLLSILVMAVLSPILVIILLFIWLALRIIKKKSTDRILLSITSGIYNAIKEKGVEWMFYDKQEGGYFKKVITLHYNGYGLKTIKLNENNTLYEISHIRKKIFNKNIRLTPLFVNAILLIFGFIYIGIKEKASLVRVNDPYISGLIGFIVSKILSIPFCVSIHADYDLQYKELGLNGASLLSYYWLAQALQSFILRHSKMVMPIRKHLADYAIKHGANPKTIRVIPHGIEPSPFLQNPDLKFKKELGINNKRVISFIGRFSKDNYIQDVIRIASLVLNEEKDVVFILAGDGDEKGIVEHLIKRQHLENGVKLLGYQSRDRVAKIRLISDISLCLMGGFSLIEAAMAGTPLIAYDVDWHYELVKNNETGYLLSKGNIVGVADAILKILNDRKLSYRMGDNARKLALEKHSLENTRKIKIKCYDELLVQ